MKPALPASSPAAAILSGIPDPAPGTGNPSAGEGICLQSPSCPPVQSRLDAASLEHWLDQGESGLSARMVATHPHLFSPACCLIPAAAIVAMQTLIAAIESVIALPVWQETVLANAPEIARLPQRARGVFMGYDFHLTLAGPQLIEINTNAGGALLAAGRIQAECWSDGKVAVPATFAAMQAQAVAAPHLWLEMFRQEWLAGKPETVPDRPLRHVLIVDEQPLAQYLAPEFLLWRTLFAAQGIQVSIADPARLDWDGKNLWCRAEAGGPDLPAPADLPIDLVYNRLTDFPLAASAQTALRAAYLAGAVVVTPHPRAHALYADKRNLILLSDPAWLAAAGVAPTVQAILLQGIPKTVAVQADAAEHFWQTRRQWFFKPADGFGSRAAYRGDKLTRRVFESILQGNHIAQAIVPPSGHPVVVDGTPQTLKADFRNYVYAGETQLCIARLYQGQTTNFRTPGGGFAPVWAV